MSQEHVETGHLSTIVQNATRGDNDAFGLIYDLLYTRMINYAYKRTGDMEATNDIVANCFYKIFRALPKFRWQHEAAFYGWCFRIASNEVKEYYKQASRYTVLEDWLEISTASPEARYNQQIDTDAQVLLLRRALERLKPLDREAVELYYFADLTHAQIGHALQKREGTIRVRIHRALRQLETIMNRQKGEASS